MDLAAGLLTEPEVMKVRRHLSGCPGCRERLEAAGIVHEAVEEGLERDLDPGTLSDVWSALEPGAVRAASRAHPRNVWRRFIGSRPSVVLAASAAAVIVVAVIAFSSKHWVETVRGSRAETGQVLIADGGEAVRTRYPCGATVELGPAGQARIEASSRYAGVLTLESGEVDVSVEKLAGGGTFVVKTSDAVVTVRGTRFSVSKTDEDSTHVSVVEGSVTVRPEGRGREGFTIDAGESAHVLSLETFLENTRRGANQAIVGGRFVEAAKLVDAYALSADQDDAAGLEMELAEALIRAGDRDGGMEIYENVASAGSSVHTQNAMALLAILQEQIGESDRSRATWTEYLLRFPEGIHAEEASAAVGSAPPGAGSPEAVAGE